MLTWDKDIFRLQKVEKIDPPPKKTNRKKSQKCERSSFSTPCDAFLNIWMALRRHIHDRAIVVELLLFQNVLARRGNLFDMFRCNVKFELVDLQAAFEMDVAEFGFERLRKLATKPLPEGLGLSATYPCPFECQSRRCP